MSEKSAKIVGSNAGSARAAVHAGVAEAVVDAALVAIGEDRVRLGGFLEALLRLLVVGIAVGMVLQRELAIRALDLLVRRLALDAEDLVVVPLVTLLTLWPPLLSPGGAADRPACSRGRTPR